MPTLADLVSKLRSSSWTDRREAAQQLAGRTGPERTAAAEALWQAWPAETDVDVQVAMIEALDGLWPRSDLRRLQALGRLPVGAAHTATADRLVNAFETQGVCGAELRQALAAVPRATPRVVELALRYLEPGNAALLRLLRQAVAEWASEPAWEALRHWPHPKEVDGLQLARELTDRGGESALRLSRDIVLSLNEGQQRAAESVLLRGLLKAPTGAALAEQVEALELIGCPRRSAAAVLLDNLPEWCNDEARGPDFWPAVWPVLGEQTPELLRKLAAHVGQRRNHRCYRQLHEMLLRHHHGLPAEYRPHLVEALRTNVWSQEASGALAGDDALTLELLRQRHDLKLDAAVLQQTLTSREAADAAVLMLCDDPEESELHKLWEVLLRAASPRSRLSAFARWDNKHLPPPAARLAAIRQCYEGHETLLHDAWRRALRDGGCYLQDAAAAKPGPLAPPGLLLLCHGTLGMRMLFYFDPLPATEVLPLLPWLELLDMEPAANGRPSAWLLAANPPRAAGVAPPPHSLVDLARGLPNWNWSEVFAVRLPETALPTFWHEV